MDLKRFNNLKEHKDRIRDEIRVIDNVLILDSQSVNIFKANNISLNDISNLLSVKSFPDYTSTFGYWGSGGELSADNKSLDYVLKILSMSKNDLAYIISKTRVLGKMLNVTDGCYFTNLLVKLENTQFASTNNKIIGSSDLDAEVKVLAHEAETKISEAIRLLGQVLNMVNENIELSFKDYDMFFSNDQEKIKELFNFTSEETISIDSSKAIMFNNSGVLVVYSNNTIQEVIAGNSEIAIKLYEDLLVGYKKNKGTTVYYSSLFVKYIIS